MQRSPLRRTLLAMTASVPVLRTQVAELVSVAGVRDPQLAAVRLAVSEAVTTPSCTRIHKSSRARPGS